MQLEGRVVLITGAARRIGRAIALRLAAQRCRLALHYHTSGVEIQRTAADCRERGAPETLTLQADLAHEPAVRDLAGRALLHFGGLDVLVNNASSFERDDIDHFDPARWERTLRVNLTAPLLLAHELRDALRSSSGRIVNLCDAGAGRNWPEHLSYVVSKAALESLTRVLARALAPRVTVVGVAPGVVAWPEHYDQRTREDLTRRIPLGRAGSPEDVAAAVEYLLRDGDYLTGVIVPVDGGRHLV